MVEIVGVRFQQSGKVYYFDPGELRVEAGELVIAETARGVECGEVVIPNQEIAPEKVPAPLKPVLRVANHADRRTLEQNRKKEEKAFRICQERIAARNLEMQLVDVECTFDNSKLLFYFTAENRVDFRDLVRDLASVFHTRIELRQIGVRDKAKMLGGIGICGREFCCKSYLQDFQPVSIKMAKEQGLSLNPAKISGCCGRLMCCLQYEEETYEDLWEITPKTGATVEMQDGTRGKVTDTNPLTGVLKVQTEESETVIRTNRDEVTVVGKGHKSQEHTEQNRQEPSEKESADARETAHASRANHNKGKTQAHDAHTSREQNHDKSQNHK